MKTKSYIAAYLLLLVIVIILMLMLLKVEKQDLLPFVFVIIVLVLISLFMFIGAVIDIYAEEFPKALGKRTNTTTSEEGAGGW